MYYIEEGLDSIEESKIELFNGLFTIHTEMKYYK